MPDLTIRTAARLAHKRLDREFAAYEVERILTLRGHVPKDLPIRSVEIEARDLVESHGYATHPNGPRGRIYGFGCPENSGHKCSGCLRLFGLMVGAANAISPKHFIALMDRVMDPAFA